MQLGSYLKAELIREVKEAQMSFIHLYTFTLSSYVFFFCILNTDDAVLNNIMRYYYYYFI